MTEPQFKVGDKIYRTANPYETETITRISTDLRGNHWYYTVTDDDTRRTIGLCEREVRRAV